MNRRQTILSVALHYARLGWHLTPGYHTAEGECEKHPTVPWSQESVRKGQAIGPTTDPEQLRSYFVDAHRIADICVHAKLSRLVVVDCDRKWKDIIDVVDGRRVTRRVFVDGLENFLGFMGGDPGTELISRSKRGLHFFYRVDSEEAARIGNGVNVLGLPGVDVRGGGATSGGVTIECNGVCPGRRWVRGTPRIEKTPENPEGVIAGVVDYGDLTFDANGNCTAGLPEVVPAALSGQPLACGLRPLPEKLLRALVTRSNCKASKDTLRGQAQVEREHRRQLLQAARLATEPTDTGDGRKVTPPAVPFTPSTLPLQLERECACGNCQQFSTAKDQLAWIPPEVDYEAWRNTIWAVSDLLDNASCGADLVAEWSGSSLVAPRRDPDQARRIYGSDHRAVRDLTGEANVDASFLCCMATLCGGPFSAVMNGDLRHVAIRHSHTLVVECGVDVEPVLQRELERVFDSLDAPSTPPPDATAANPGSHSTLGAQPYQSLGTAWGPLPPGILDEQLPPAPALLHFPTRQGKQVTDPLQGDTLIPMGEVGMLVAPGSTGKTMFFLQLLVAVATGTPFLGRFAVGAAASRRPVVMVCAEDRYEQIVRRLQLICRSLQVSLSPAEMREAERRIHIVSVSGVGPDRLLLRTVDGVPQPTDSAEKFTQHLMRLRPSLVVLDPLSRLLSGNVDLSSEVGTGWVSMLEAIVRALGHNVAILFAHHSNKASRGSASLSKEEGEPEARGTTGLFDGVRIEGYLKALADDEVVFRIRKNNHGPRMAFADRVILVRGPHGILRVQTDEERATREGLRAQEKASERDQQDEDTKRRILVAMARHKPTSMEELRALVKRGADSVRSCVVVLSSSAEGKPALVRDKKKNAPFEIDTKAVAARHPELVDQSGKALKLGSWCTQEWPKELRDEGFTIPLEGA